MLTPPTRDNAARASFFAPNELIILMLCHNYYCFFYLPYLSSIHEKANCIAIFWTGCPHSLESCRFRGVWAIFLPHIGEGVPLNALSKDTTNELDGLLACCCRLQFAYLDHIQRCRTFRIEFYFLKAKVTVMKFNKIVVPQQKGPSLEKLSK